MYVESRWTYSFWASADLRKAARWRTGGGSSSYVSCGWSSNGIIVMSVMVEQTSCLLLLLLWLYFAAAFALASVVVHVAGNGVTAVLRLVVEHCPTQLTF